MKVLLVITDTYYFFDAIWQKLKIQLTQYIRKMCELHTWIISHQWKLLRITFMLQWWLFTKRCGEWRIRSVGTSMARCCCCRKWLHCFTRDVSLSTVSFVSGISFRWLPYLYQRAGNITREQVYVLFVYIFIYIDMYVLVWVRGKGWGGKGCREGWRLAGCEGRRKGNRHTVIGSKRVWQKERQKNVNGERIRERNKNSQWDK